MNIGILTVTVLIPDSLSLKQKRQALRSLKERLKNTFNISIAEVDNHDKWQIATLAIANVNIDKKKAQSQLYKIIDFINKFNRLQLTDTSIELL